MGSIVDVLNKKNGTKEQTIAKAIENGGGGGSKVFHIWANAPVNSETSCAITDMDDIDFDEIYNDIADGKNWTLCLAVRADNSSLGVDSTTMYYMPINIVHQTEQGTEYKIILAACFAGGDNTNIYAYTLLWSSEGNPQIESYSYSMNT